jgi:integrase
MQMFKWAELRKPWRALLVEGNPAELVNINKLLPPNYKNERERELSRSEIWKLNRIFIDMTNTYQNASNKYSVERPLKLEAQKAIWIALSTLARVGELMMTKWEHIDFSEKTWRIPKINTKGKRQEHIVYLSDFSLAQFKFLYGLNNDSEWVFPARYKSDSHVDIKTITKQIGDRQIKLKNRTKPLQFHAESNSLVLGDESWTMHDLRRTGATLMQGLKVPVHVIDLCQNHLILTSTQKHYLLHDYAQDKKDAWQRLGEEINQIITSPICPAK